MTQHELDHLTCSLTVSARPLVESGGGYPEPEPEPDSPPAAHEVEPPPCPFRHIDVGGDELRIDWPPVLRPGTFTLVTAIDEDSGTAVRVELTYDAVRRLSGQLDALLGKPWLRSRQPEPARIEPAPPWSPPDEKLSLKDEGGNELEIKRTYDGKGLRIDLGPGDIELTPGQAHELYLYLKTCFGDG